MGAVVGEGAGNPTQDTSQHQDDSIFLDLLFLGYFLRIGIPWDENHHLVPPFGIL